MDRFYTLPEIARITGIPLEELEQYERDFPDLLPAARFCPATSGSPGTADSLAVAPIPTRAVSRPSPRTRRWQRLWLQWVAAAKRVRWWSLFVYGARLLVWWRKWRKAFEPA
jgi:hypothetical protein